MEIRPPDVSKNPQIPHMKRTSANKPDPLGVAIILQPPPIYKQELVRLPFLTI